MHFNMLMMYFIDNIVNHHHHVPEGLGVFPVP